MRKWIIFLLLLFSFTSSGQSIEGYLFNSTNTDSIKDNVNPSFWRKLSYGIGYLERLERIESKIYAHYSDWNLLLGRNLDKDNDTDLASFVIENNYDEKGGKKLPIKYFGMGIFTGDYFRCYSEIHRNPQINLPPFLHRVGGKVFFRRNSTTFSISVSYSYTRNLICYLLGLYSPPELKFWMVSLSFLYTYSKKFLSWLEGYGGGGIHLSYISLFYSGYIGNVYYNEEVDTGTYLSPLITAGLQLDIKPSLCMAIQTETSLYHPIKWGSSALHLKDILPSITINLGYKFNLRW